MKHKMTVLLFGLALLIIGLTPVNAKEFISTHKGSLSLNLIDLENNQSIVGANFAIYHIASVSQSDTGELIYTYTDEYKDCGIFLDDSDISSKLETFVSDKPYTSLVTTDKNGQASINDLPLGLYFVKQIDSPEGYALCQSFIVTLPVKENGRYIYDVDASPKTEIEKYVSISIEKQWKTDKKSKIPGKVTVELYKDNKVVKTAVLSKDNNWKIVFENMPKSDTYSIKEINVPKGYSDIYKQNGYAFTVINVSSLIDTGQLLWPIPILALTGIFCITAGFAVVRKSSKNNG